MQGVTVAKQRQALSVALLFAPVFVAVYLSHWALLQLPYYWDEGSYYIPAAWDFYRLRTLIPVTTLRNAHPPLPSIVLAGWWKLTGFHIGSTRLLMCLVTTVALLAVFRLVQRLLDDVSAVTVLVLTAAYPVWFAQSTLAHADMFAAALLLWGLSSYADRVEWTRKPSVSPIGSNIKACVLFSLAVLAKETAIIVPAALFLLELWLVRHTWRKDRTGSATVLQTPHDRSLGEIPNFAVKASRLCATALPVLPLLAWYTYHRAKTGFAFGNPEFLRYNATANLSPLRILLSLWHRLSHLTVHMNLFVPTLLACAVVLTRRRVTAVESPPFLTKAATQFVFVLLLAQWFSFSLLGGALLTRYLLPAYPLVLLLCVGAWRHRSSYWPVFAALTFAAFAIGCEVAPPYAFTPEDNLAYRDMIVVHQDAIRELLRRDPGATVLTAWPVVADLQRPELGYVQAPVQTVNVENFSAEEIAKAAAKNRSYKAALVFSTKYDPPTGGLNLSGTNRAHDSRFYDYHRDLRPLEIAHALGGTVVWQEERKGEWAAVLQFADSVDVQRSKPSSSTPHL